jgi:hypothetical protein
MEDTGGNDSRRRYKMVGNEDVVYQLLSCRHPLDAINQVVGPRGDTLQACGLCGSHRWLPGDWRAPVLLRP